ncbi:MAG: Ig-like domain-containing protein, partial [Bacteroidales bacterium]|nr:Ig-like domain-containing protein [Bacteroidales bacterium]
MKKRAILTVLFFVFFIGYTFADGNTFRKNYSFSMMDFPGRIIQTSSGDFVFCGYNSGGIPVLSGHVTKIDEHGNVIWSKKIGGFSIATILYDVIEISSSLGGGYLVAGETSPGAILVRLDEDGNILWSSKYQFPDHESVSSSEWINKVIETSDGEFLACGGVSHYWDNVSSAPIDSVMPFAIKIDAATGNNIWDEVFHIVVPNDDEHQFYNVTETTDGYIFVGSTSQGSGTLNEDGNYPRDGLVIKTDTDGNYVYCRIFGDANKSEVIEDIITLSTGEVLMTGYRGDYGFILRINGTGNTPTISFGKKYNNQYQYSTIPFPPYGLFAAEPIAYSEIFEMSDGNYALIGTYFHTYSLMEIHASATRINKNDGSVLLANTFTSTSSEINLSFGLLPKGGITGDNSFFIFMQSMDMGAFSYHMTKSDENGSMNNPECPEGTYNPEPTAYSPILNSITPTIFLSTAKPADFINPALNDLTPTVTTLCEVILCDPILTPVVDADPMTICPGEEVTISSSGSGIDVTYNYYTEPVGGTAFNSGEEIFVYPTTTTTYYVDAEDNAMPGCFSDRESVTSTVNEPPAIDDPADVISCDDYDLPVLTIGGNYFLSSGGVDPVSVGTTIIENTTIYVFGQSGTVPNCTVENSFTITFYTAPDINDIEDQNPCKIFEFPVITGVNLTGNQAYFAETNGGGVMYNAGDLIDFDDFSSYPVTFYIYDNNNGCFDEESFTLTLYETPDIDNLADQSHCESYELPAITGLDLTGAEAYYTESGGLGTSYNAGQVLNYEDFVSYPVTLYVYDAEGPCSDEESFNLTISMFPDVDNLGDQVLCDLFQLPLITGTYLSGNETYYTLPDGAGTSYNSGDVLNFTDFGLYPVTLFIYDINGVCADEESFSLTMYQIPQITEVEDQSVCNQFQLPAIQGNFLTGNQSYYTESGAGGTAYNAGDIIHFADYPTYPMTLHIYDIQGICDNEQSFELSIYKNTDLVITDIYCDAGFLTYTVEFTYTTGTISTTAGTIDGLSVINIPIDSDVTITADNTACVTNLFIPAPDCSCQEIVVDEPTNLQDQQVCLGETNPALTVDSPLPAEDYQINWYSNQFGGIPLASATTSFTPDVIESGVYTYYAAAIDLENGCSSDRIPVLLTILPEPEVSGDLIICDIGLTTSLTGSGTPHLTTPWTSNNTDIATVDNLGVVTAIAAGSTVITYMDSDGCTTEAIVNVIIISTIAINDIDLLCSNDIPIILTATVNGGIWSGPGIINSGLGVFSPQVAGQGTHQVFYNYYSVCGNVSDDAYIIVLLAPDATINPAGPFCLGASEPITLTAVEDGGVWEGAGITDVNAGVFNPDLAGIGEHEIIYIISNACFDSDTIHISVLENFDATIDEVDPMCTNDGIITLTAGSAGGTWTGSGITDENTGTFNSIIAGAGNHTITYELIGTCGDSDQIEIVVNQSPDASITPTGSFCEDAPAVLLEAAEEGGLWSGTAIVDTSGLFSPILAGIGSHNIQYTILGVCSDSSEITVEVLEKIPATISTTDNYYCYDNDTIELIATPIGGVWYGESVNSLTGEFNIYEAGVGTHEIIYSYIGACSDVDTIYITVAGWADATITPVDTLTDQDDPVQLIAAQDGGVWDGIFVNLFGIFNPQEAGAAEHQVIYTIEGLCGDADTTKI